MADEGLKDIKGQQIDSNYDEVIDNFDNMELAPELLRGMSRFRFLSLSAVTCVVVVDNSPRYLCLWFREAVRYPVPSYSSCN